MVLTAGIVVILLLLKECSVWNKYSQRRVLKEGAIVKLTDRKALTKKLEKRKIFSENEITLLQKVNK